MDRTEEVGTSKRSPRLAQPFVRLSVSGVLAKVRFFANDEIHEEVPDLFRSWCGKESTLHPVQHRALGSKGAHGMIKIGEPITSAS